MAKETNTNMYFQECEVVSSKLLRAPIDIELQIFNNEISNIDIRDFEDYISGYFGAFSRPDLQAWLRKMRAKYVFKDLIMEKSAENYVLKFILIK